MIDPQDAYLNNPDFYVRYAGYLREPRVRQRHDKVFRALKRHPAFCYRVMDLGCGKSNEFFYHGRPDFYLGLDQNANIVNDPHRRTDALDYRNHLEEVKSLIKDCRISGVISLFSTEPTKPSYDNHLLYEELFGNPAIAAIFVAGFYYQHAKGQEMVKEAGGLVSYQTSGEIDRPETPWFYETRVEIPGPSKLFGEDVVEVYRLLQRYDHFDPVAAQALAKLAPPGYLATTRLADNNVPRARAALRRVRAALPPAP